MPQTLVQGPELHENLCAKIKTLSVQIWELKPNYTVAKAVTNLDDVVEVVCCTFRKSQMAMVKKKQSANARQFNLFSWVKPKNK